MTVHVRIRVEFAHSARDDLRDIMDWYASQDVPEVGRRLAMEVIERVRQLERFPDSGRMVPEFDSTWLRELEHPPFRIVYRRDEESVTIVRVWRSERLLEDENELQRVLGARRRGGRCGTWA
jgi:plasmid stabilization system protein ParE